MGLSRRSIAALIALVLPLFVAGYSAQDAHPIKRVIALIQNLAEKAKADGEAEAVTYEGFTHWCGKTTETLGKAIAKEKADIESLKNKVDAKKSEDKTLTKQVQALTKEVSEIQASAAKAAADRSAAIALVNSSLKDFDDTISALTQAIDGLVSSTQAPAAVASKLIQMPMALAALSDDQQAMLVQLSSSPLTGAAPQAKTYDVKSGGIVDMLKKMKFDFVDQRAKLVADDAAAATQYIQLKGAIDEKLAVADEAKKTKELNHADVQQTLNADSTSLKSLKDDLQADSKTLEDTTLSCKIKADEYKQRVAMRKQEQEAFKYGLSILEQVANVRSTVPSKPASFFQLRLDAAKPLVEEMKIREAALQHLLDEATAIHSQSLLDLYRKVSAHVADVPQQVQQQVNLTIAKQIFAMRDEQLAEDKKAQWCALQINKTGTSIQSKVDELRHLEDSSTKGKSSVALLQQEVQAAEKTIEEIQASNHQAASLRQAEQNENQQTLKDAQDAEVALREAIDTLQKFYKDAANQVAFIQNPTTVAQAPASWDTASYKGSSASEQVIAVLQQTTADFAKLEADTQAKESSEQSQYEADMRDAQIEMDRRKSDIESKTEQSKRLEEKIAEWQKTHDLEDRSRLLLISELEELKKQCNTSAYEARKSSRAVEIKSLQDAQVNIASAFTPSTAAPSLVAMTSEKALRGSAIARRAEVQQLSQVQPHAVQDVLTQQRRVIRLATLANLLT
jgi:hypothetical protein